MVTNSQLTKTAPVLTIFVPFSIPSREIPKLGQKIRKKFGKNVVLDIKYDPDLIGGAAFAFGGKYWDFSVRSKIINQRAKRI